MSDIRPGANTQAQFFAKNNEVMLDRLLNADFQRRIGGDLTEKQRERLDKTVRHYMTEAYAKNPEQSIQYLNKEVLTAVVPDYMAYLRRAPTGTTAATLGPAPEETLRTDVNSRFSQLQNERQDIRAGPPPPPDFQISLGEDGPTPLSRFEEIKRIRDAEAARETEIAAARRETQDIVVSPRDSGMSRFVDSDIDFRNGAAAADERDQLSLIMREAEREAARATSRTTEVYPDPRRILLGEATVLPPRSQGIASANPTMALPERVRDRPVLPQDVLKPQDDIVAYKEVEHNLFVYSADRDWVSNTTENRYNFSVNFDPANNQSGFGYNTATNVKFKNIVRVEFVKAIMPTESFDILVTSPSGTPSSTLNTNILSFPYLQVRIPELNVNGYGTNDGINNAFAAISYDAYWTSDSNAANRGYARMIPKFLKCQKVYYPTPLSTLQKLTFQIQRPDGTLVSTTNDTLTVSMILMPTNGASTTNYKGTGAATYEWIWLQTSTYFNQFMFTQGDRIVLKNVSFNSAFTTAGFVDIVNYLTQPQGILISAIGRSNGLSTGYTDGANSAGYANSIIISNSFQDPTTGSTAVSTWVPNYVASVTTLTNTTPANTYITPGSGTSVTLAMNSNLRYAAGMTVFVTNVQTPASNFTGIVSSYTAGTGILVVNTIANINGTFPSSGTATYVVTAGTIPSAARMINMNHQIQIIMRVITREMDSAAKLRPDNLQA